MNTILRKSLIVVLVLSFTPSKILAQTSGQIGVPQAEKIKAKVAKLGTGEKAKAKIKLHTGEKLKGYISSAGENDFTVTNKKSGQSKTLAYSDVDEVKKPGLSKGTKIAIVVVIGAVVAAAIIALVIANTFPNFTLSNTPH